MPLREHRSLHNATSYTTHHHCTVDATGLAWFSVTSHTSTFAHSHTCKLMHDWMAHRLHVPQRAHTSKSSGHDNLHEHPPHTHTRALCRRVPALRAEREDRARVHTRTTHEGVMQERLAGPAHRKLLSLRQNRKVLVRVWPTCHKMIIHAEVCVRGARERETEDTESCPKLRST